MSLALSFALVVFFLVMNAFFVIAEFSLVRIRKSQVDILASEGARGAKQAKKISENVNDYLSACQLGITIASLALGWLGEPAFGRLFEPLFEIMGLSEATMTAASVAIGFILLTAFHIVIGELLPKSWAILDTEKYACMTAPVLSAFYKLTYPIMIVFNGITNGFMKITGHSNREENDTYSEDELQMLVEESYQKGEIEEVRYQYIDNIFDLEGKDAGDIMTARPDMVCLYKEDSYEDNMDIIHNTQFTRYPVCFEEKDNIVGFVHIKDLVNRKGSGKSLPIRPIQAVPESTPISAILELFQTKKTKIAVVVDEHGGTSGIVTLSDIFGQIVGRIEDEYVHEDIEDFESLDENHYRFGGGVEIHFFADLIDLEIEDDYDECTTVSGLFLNLAEHMPSVGEEIAYKNIVMKVTEMEGHRITAVEVRVDPVTDDENEE